MKKKQTNSTSLSRAKLQFIVDSFVMNPKFILQFLYHSIDIQAHDSFDYVYSRIKTDPELETSKDSIDWALCIKIACARNDDKLIKIMLTHAEKLLNSVDLKAALNPCLASCACNNNLKMYKLLVKAGADISYNPAWLFRTLTATDNLEFMKYLVETLKYSLSEGGNALGIAIESEAYECAKYLFIEKHSYLPTPFPHDFLDIVGDATLKHMLFKKTLPEQYKELIGERFSENKKQRGGVK